MPHAGFVHLRVHSAYSLSEGAIKVKQLVELCRREKMPAVALADTGNLFAAMEFSMAASEAGIQPILGCRLGVRRTDEGLRGGRALAPDVIVLLVQNEVGYRNLSRLVSKSFLETEPGEAPQVAQEVLEAHAEGLIALTAGPSGTVGR